MLEEKYKKIIAFAVYIIIVIGTEFAYRQELFNASVDIQRKWHDTFVGREKVMNFFSYFFVLITLPFCIFIFLFLPLNQFFQFFSANIYAVAVSCLMKMMYANPRPFWQDEKIKIKCEGGFGNPSSHSFLATTLYLSLWDVIVSTEKFEKICKDKLPIFKYLLLVFFSLIIIFVAISRTFLNLHAFNQILYGCLLGIALYFFYYHILEMDKKNKGTEFFKHLWNKMNNIIYFSFYGIFIFIAFMLYYLRKVDKFEEWEEILAKCSISERSKMKKEAMLGSLTILAVIGFHYGLVLLRMFVDKMIMNKHDELNNWNQMEIKKRFICLAIMVPFGLIALPFLLVKRYENAYFLTITILTLIIAGFCIGFCYFVILIKLKFVNNELFENTCKDEDESHEKLKIKTDEEEKEMV